MPEMGHTLKLCPVALFSDSGDFAEHSSIQCQGLDELPVLHCLDEISVEVQGLKCLTCPDAEMEKTLMLLCQTV